jgi:hypothetical protein
MKKINNGRGRRNEKCWMGCDRKKEKAKRTELFFSLKKEQKKKASKERAQKMRTKEESRRSKYTRERTH